MSVTASSSAAMSDSLVNRLSRASTAKANDHSAFLDSLPSASSSSSPANESMDLGFGVGVTVGLALTLTAARPLVSLITAFLAQSSSSSPLSTPAVVAPALTAVVINGSAALSDWAAIAPSSLSSSSVFAASFTPLFSSSALLLPLSSLPTPTLSQLLTVFLLLSLAYLYHILTRPLIFQRPLTAEAREAALRKSYADMPPPYPNAWFKLCDIMDVQGGRSYTTQALGMQLTVGRSATGELWCTDPTGQMWEVCEANRVIFLWHDEMRRSSAWQIPVVNHDMGRWRFVGRTVHEIVCHIQEIPENGADTAHLAFLHGDFVLDFITAAKHTWEASWIPQPLPNAHIAHIAIDTQVALFGRKLGFTTVQTRITQVGPGIVQMKFPTPFGDILLQETITPIHSNVQRACHVLWCEPSVPRLVAKAIMKSTLMQFERDFIVWNSKRWIRAPLAVRADGPILKYRRWVKQFFDRDGGELIRDFDGNETMVERQQRE